MNKNILFNIVLGSMIVATVAVFGALGERRLDVYMSMFTLEYFISIAIFRPRRRMKDLLAVALLTIFLIIVGFRIVEILLK